MDARNTGIGGSDVGTIVGCRGAYLSPWQCWALKTGLNPPQVPSEQMLMGHVLEPVILALHRERTGLAHLAGIDMLDGTAWDVRTTLRHPLHPWAMGHFDAVAFVDGAHLVVDAKNTQRRGLGDDEDIADVDAGEVPEPWWLQLHHYAWIIRAWGLPVADVAHVAALVNGSTYRTMTVPLDIDWYERDIVPQLADFWACVAELREPPGLAVAPEVKPPPFVETMGAARRYLEAAARVKLAESEKESEKALVMAELAKHGDPARAMADGAKLSLARSDGRTSIDAAALKANYPDAYAATVRQGDPYRTLRVTETRK